MTDPGDDAWIALAMLHGPSTVEDSAVPVERATCDPLNQSPSGTWWVFRADLAQPSFSTAGQAARHYCKHYGITPEVTDEATPNDEAAAEALPPAARP